MQGNFRSAWKKRLIGVWQHDPDGGYGLPLGMQVVVVIGSFLITILAVRLLRGIWALVFLYGGLLSLGLLVILYAMLRVTQHVKGRQRIKQVAFGMVGVALMIGMAVGIVFDADRAALYIALLAVSLLLLVYHNKRRGNSAFRFRWPR